MKGIVTVTTPPLKSIAHAARTMADSYAARADSAKRAADVSATTYSWHMGRQSVFLEAELNLRTLADMAWPTTEGET
jgi:hypothetical protein